MLRDGFVNRTTFGTHERTAALGVIKHPQLTHGESSSRCASDFGMVVNEFFAVVPKALAQTEHVIRSEHKVEVSAASVEAAYFRMTGKTESLTGL